MAISNSVRLVVHLLGLMPCLFHNFNAALVAIEGGDPGILQTFARVGKAGLESYGEIEQLINKERDELDQME